MGTGCGALPFKILEVCVLKAEGKLARAIYLSDLAHVGTIVYVLDFVAVPCILEISFVESFQIMVGPWDKVSLKSSLCQRK